MNNIELDDAWGNPPPYPNIRPISQRSSIPSTCTCCLFGLLIGLLLGLSGIVATIFYIYPQYQPACQLPDQPTLQPTLQLLDQPTMNQMAKKEKYIVIVPHSTLLTDAENAHRIMSRGDYMYEEYAQFKKKYVSEANILLLIKEFMVGEMVFIFNMHYISRKNGIRYVNLLNSIVRNDPFFFNFNFEVENSTETYYYKSVETVKTGYPNIKYSDLFTITGYYDIKMFSYHDDNRGQKRPNDDCPPFGGWKCLLYVFQIET